MKTIAVLKNRDRHTTRSRRKRGAVMLEFAIMLPFTLFFLVFSIDMGRAVYAANALQDAAYTAARQSAIFGKAGSTPPEGSAVPTDPNTRAATIKGCKDLTTTCDFALQAFARAVDEVPGAKIAKNVKLIVKSGSAKTGSAEFGNTCKKATPLVGVTITYTIDWLTPGMGGLLDIVGTSDSANVKATDRQLQVNATARCEVEVP